MPEKIHTQYHTLYDSLEVGAREHPKRLARRGLKMMDSTDVLTQRTILGLIMTHAFRSGLDPCLKLPYGIVQTGPTLTTIQVDRLDPKLLSIIGNLPTR